MKITAYKLTRSEGTGWMYAGRTPDEVLNTLKCELESDAELIGCGDVPDLITIEPYETTQEEIDNLPDFEGW